ncbi:MAG: sporulation protein YabP [Clostridia bacterium]|nr:sporulation protein YabP [Clostridia bacterium]
MIDEKRFGKTGTKETSQNIIMENRKKLSVSGVLDVESFDEDSVFLYTEAGMLNIKGEELHINKLSVESGDVTVEGQISALIYTEEDGKTRGSLLSKIFK